jgi:DNA-binding NtrC family response regulator
VARDTLLIVDDEETVRVAVQEFLERSGYRVLPASSCREAQEALAGAAVDAAVVDYWLPDGNALELLPRLHAALPGLPVVILTGHGTIDLAVRAIKEGAEHFLTKPVELKALLVLLERVLDNARNRQQRLAGRARERRLSLDPFLGASDAIRRLREEALRLRCSESPILIQGETGTGKGVLARWLHDEGPRAGEAFVDLNCAGLTRDFLETELFGHEKGAFTGAASAKQGLLEVAHRGSVFLDEIGDMDPEVQPRLLKVLEEKRFRRLGDVRDRQVDIRLIAATHHDLLALVQQKRFRSDLYFRIHTLPLAVPPLRTRVEDVLVLAESLLGVVASELARPRLSLSRDAAAALQAYAWPGNIRELRNVLERAALLSDGEMLTRRDLRFEPVPLAEPGGATLQEMERLHIERTLREEGGRVEQAARRLGVPRSSLYQKIKKFGLSIRAQSKI